MAAKYDVVATVGTYEKDGQTKYLTQAVGSVIETSKGPRLKMKAWFNLSACQKDADGSVWLALFEPKAKDSTQKSLTNEQPFDDEIPF